MNFIEIIEKEDHSLFGILQSTNIYREISYNYFVSNIDKEYTLGISAFYDSFKDGLSNRLDLITCKDKKEASEIKPNITPKEFGEIVAEIVINKNHNNISFRK